MMMLVRLVVDAEMTPSGNEREEHREVPCCDLIWLSQR
jgi:hypothetical protein